MFLNIDPALALSNGCAAINALSGSSSLAYNINSYRASELAAGDSLTLQFTDSGAGKGCSPKATDSLSIARQSLSNAQTYNAATPSATLRTASPSLYRVAVSRLMGLVYARAPLVTRSATWCSPARACRRLLPTRPFRGCRFPPGAYRQHFPAARSATAPPSATRRHR